MTEARELLACPICNENVKLFVPHAVGESSMIQCGKCMLAMDGFYYEGTDELVKWWNTRTANRDRDLRLVKYLRVAFGWDDDTPEEIAEFLDEFNRQEQEAKDGEG